MAGAGGHQRLQPDRLRVVPWGVEAAPHKLKKAEGKPALTFTANPDILAAVAASPKRPRLVVGFAAETEALIDNARAKLASKRADWIVANDVSGDVMGGDDNRVSLVSASGVETWEHASKAEVAARLAQRIADALA